MYKILSKQNFSIALTLLLTILLSQTNIMNLFFSTILGRTLLVLILLCISYTNHILGIVSTLFVMMLFLGSYTYAENFAVTSEVPSEAPVPVPVLNTDETDVLDNNYSNSEGFDILGTEQNLQRGKKSNTIMVNEDMRTSDNVEPHDGNNPSQYTSIS